MLIIFNEFLNNFKSKMLGFNVERVLLDKNPMKTISRFLMCCVKIRLAACSGYVLPLIEVGVFFYSSLKI